MPSWALKQPSNMFTSKLVIVQGWAGRILCCEFLMGTGSVFVNVHARIVFLSGEVHVSFCKAPSSVLCVLPLPLGLLHPGRRRTRKRGGPVSFFEAERKTEGLEGAWVHSIQRTEILQLVARPSRGSSISEMEFVRQYPVVRSLRRAMWDALSHRARNRVTQL